MSAKTHQKLMNIFASSCHQLPERSFFFKKWQFPVCARCTGTYIGNVLAVICAFFFIPRPEYLLVGCAVILTDWLVQFTGIRDSTNPRRLLTGIVGGYSLMSLLISLAVFAAKAIL